MDKYQQYLSAIGNDLFRSIQDPFKLPDRRIGSSYPNVVSDKTRCKNSKA